MVPRPISIEWVFTLALTPTLSPKERERIITIPNNFSVLMAVTDSVSSAVGIARPSDISPGAKRGERSSLSGGRGPG